MDIKQSLRNLIIHIDVELKHGNDPTNNELEDEYDRGFNDAYDDIKYKLQSILATIGQDE